MPAHVTVSQFPDRPALVAAAAEQFAALLRGIQADPAGGIHGDGVARVVLTGGTAGIELLSAMLITQRIELR